MRLADLTIYIALIPTTIVFLFDFFVFQSHMGVALDNLSNCLFLAGAVVLTVGNAVIVRY